MKRRLATLFLLVSTGCAGTRATPAPHVSCDERAALPRELLEPGSVVLFGETHGSQELPAFFAEAVCTAAASGLAIEVGLEQPSSSQADIDGFLSSAGGDSALASVLAGAHWHREYQDGRSSRAQVDLLERLRALRERELAIHVFLFDPWPDDKANNRDDEMARRIAAHVRAHETSLTLVLVGEVHAWTAIGSPWDPTFHPMGWSLVQDGLRVKSLGRATPAGTQWVCTGPTVSDCGEKPTRAMGGSLPSGRPFGIELLPEPNQGGNVGLYAVPTLTASPPALP
jgi:hypothetical protein